MSFQGGERGENSFANVNGENFHFNNTFQTQGVSDDQDQSFNNQLETVLVSSNSTGPKQPSWNSDVFSTHSLPLSQAPSFNFFPLGDHTIAPYPSNGFISSSTELINGQYPSVTVDATMTRDQGHSVPQSSQQQSLLSEATMQLLALNPSGFNPNHVPIASESLRSTNPAGTIRAITAAGSTNLCHNHYNLIQSFASFKSSVSFHINTTECIICSSISQGVRINPYSTTANTQIVRPDHAVNSEGAQPQTHPQGVVYCSFAGCNRAIGSDRPFKRNDNRNEHEQRVHGIPRRRRN